MSPCVAKKGIVLNSAFILMNILFIMFLSFHWARVIQVIGIIVHLMIIYKYSKYL